MSAFFSFERECVKVNISCSVWTQINMMLANLYKKAGQERSAVTSYKEVLRQCPLALDAIIGKHNVTHICLTPVGSNKSIPTAHIFRL